MHCILLLLAVAALCCVRGATAKVVRVNAEAYESDLYCSAECTDDACLCSSLRNASTLALAEPANEGAGGATAAHTDADANVVVAPTAAENEHAADSVAPAEAAAAPAEAAGVDGAGDDSDKVRAGSEVATAAPAGDSTDDVAPMQVDEEPAVGGDGDMGGTFVQESSV